LLLRLDEAQDFKALSPREAELRKSLKLRTLGLVFLVEGDANTRFFHLQACHRKRKSRIDSLSVDGVLVVNEDLMAKSLYEYYNSILGSNFERSRRINLDAIGLPSLELGGLEAFFTEEEVHAVVMDLPNDKAPGPDGFTGIFYKKAWDIIKGDVLNAFNAFWS
jgi:hypothetical protein